MSDVKKYGSWYKAFFTMNQTGRTKVLAMVIETLSKSKDSSDRKTASLLNEGSWEVIGMCPFIEYAKVQGTKFQLDTSCVNAFGDECLLLKKKGASIACLVKPELNFKNAKISVHAKNNEGDVKKYSSWYKAFFTMNQAARTKVLAMVLETLSKSKDANDRKAAVLLNEGSWEVIGICPFIEYAKVQGTKFQLDTSWVHAFGDECLLLQQKGISMACLVKPGLKFNDAEMSVYSENHEFVPPGQIGGLTS